MTTVYILGAGVSHSAGYPLAKQLIAEMEEFVRQRADSNTHFSWKAFQNWALSHSNDEYVKLALSTGNPEDVITFMDYISLCREGVKHREIFGEIKDKDIRPLLEKMEEIDNARLGLRETMIDYFAWKNQFDHLGRNNQARRFIHTFCHSMVQENDLIITFNYDTLVERSLYELQKWSPKDGYGLEFDLRLATWNGDKLIFDSSAVKVLKIHGSLGWFYNPWERRLSLDYSTFLKNLIPGARDSNEHLVPEAEDAVLLVPSYIKDVKHIELQKVWNLAAEAVRAVQKIVVVGYSMPVADSAAQHLICSNVASNTALQEFSVIDKSKRTYQRYQKLIDFPITHVHSSFEEWVESIVCNNEAVNS